jgi:hypothetical protein
MDSVLSSRVRTKTCPLFAFSLASGLWLFVFPRADLKQKADTRPVYHVRSSEIRLGSPIQHRHYRGCPHRPPRSEGTCPRTAVRSQGTRSIIPSNTHSPPRSSPTPATSFNRLYRNSRHWPRSTQLSCSAGLAIKYSVFSTRAPIGHSSGRRTACVRPALSSLLNGNADLSGDMALRIEKAFGVRMDTLMRMQASYDIAQTRKREKQIHVRRIHAVPVHV